MHLWVIPSIGKVLFSFQPLLLILFIDVLPYFFNIGHLHRKLPRKSLVSSRRKSIRNADRFCCSSSSGNNSGQMEFSLTSHRNVMQVSGISLKSYAKQNYLELSQVRRNQPIPNSSKVSNKSFQMNFVISLEVKLRVVDCYVSLNYYKMKHSIVDLYILSWKHC